MTNPERKPYLLTDEEAALLRYLVRADADRRNVNIQSSFSTGFDFSGNFAKSDWIFKQMYETLGEPKFMSKWEPIKENDYYGETSFFVSVDSRGYGVCYGPGSPTLLFIPDGLKICTERQLDE